MSGSVARISIAPIKGLGLVHPESVELEPHGVTADRRFHLIDERGKLMNGKRFGRLVRVRPEYDAEADTLSLQFPDGTEISGPVVAGEPATTIFYGRPVAGHLVEGAFSDAISEYAGKPLRLVRSDCPGEAVDRAAGGGAVSLVTATALDGVGVAAGAGRPLDGRRFRMMFELDGLDPHAEDGWLDRPVRVGEAVVIPRGHVGRCLVTSQDPDTGVPDVDVLAALRTFRADLGSTEPLPFGVFGEVARPGTVRVGDPIEP